MPKTKKKGGFLSAIIRINVVIVLLVGVATFFFFFQGDSNAADSAEHTGPVATVLYDLEEPFITNVQGSTRLLKTDVSIEYGVSEKPKSGGEGEAENPMEEFNPRIRDAIIITLRGITVEDLSNPCIQDILKKEIIESVQKELEEEKFGEGKKAEPIEIVNVYFHEFLAS